MVGLVDYVQEIGPLGNVAEVEASRACRGVLRSNDYNHGAYGITLSYGSSAFNSTGTTALTNILLAGFLWSTTDQFCAIKKVTAHVAGTCSGSGSGIIRLGMFRAPTFTRQFDLYQPTSGALPYIAVNASGVVLGQGNKLRNTFLNSDGSGNTTYGPTTNNNIPGPLVVYANVQSSSNPTPSALTGGQYTLDPVPLGQIVTSMVNAPLAAINKHIQMPPQVLFDTEIGPPLILENFSGLVFNFDYPGTNSGAITFEYNINIQWDEVTTYTLGANT